MANDREAAQRAYADMQKSSNPSAFDAMGAFSAYYNPTAKSSDVSFALPLDMGKSLPIKDRASAVSYWAGQQKQNQVANQQQDSQTWYGRAFAGMEKLYNFSTQAISFGLTLGQQGNPIWQGDFNLGKVKEAWDKSHDISVGRSLMRVAVGDPLSSFESVFTGVAKAVGQDGKLAGADKFLQDHLLFASNQFDIFDKSQAEKAFREQNIGRFTSFGTDVVARFIVDPTIVGGKIYKAAKAGEVAVEGVKGLNKILATEAAGLTKKNAAAKATFLDFIEKTDGMNQSELFRVKAIRESSNPGSFADVLATANKIEDTAARHAAKADIIKMAMGDAEATQRLMKQGQELSVRVANLQDEVADIKFLGSSVDKKTGLVSFDFNNTGVELEKATENLALHEKELANIHQKLSAEAIINPNQVPKFDTVSGFRNAISKSDAILKARGQSFTDLSNGLSGSTTRVLTSFFYKRPRGWIDFTDNQSVQTVDNMLTRVRGISARQEEIYKSQIGALDDKLKNPIFNLSKEEIKAAKKEKAALEKDLATASFSVEKRNALFNEYTAAVSPAERAVAFQKIEEELFNTVAKQFGHDKASVAKAWKLFSTKRAQTHNVIRERAYTGATKTLEDGRVVPVGSKIVPIKGSEGLNYVVPLPLNETQLVKELPVLDLDTMYSALRKYSRAQRIEKGNKVVKTIYNTGTSFKRTGTDVVDSLDSLIKFEVLARIGYPVRNVSEGLGRVLTTVGPMAIVNGISEGGRNLIKNRFRNANLEDIYKWSDETKLATELSKLKATRHLSDNVDEVDAQIVELENMLAGKVKVQDKFGLGLREVDGITYEDALGSTPERAEYIRKKFIKEAGRIVDDHHSASRTKLNNAFETTGDFVVINGTDPNWAQGFERVVNKQIRNSKISRILLQDKPREQLITEAETFLTRTTEGRKIMKDLALGRDARAIAEANMDNIDEIFPPFAAGLKKKALEKNINYDDIIKHFGTDTLNYPSINAAQIASANGMHSLLRHMADIKDGFYKYFGEVPESSLVRHPMYVDLYRKRMDAMVRNAIDTFPGQEIPAEYLRKLEYSARQWSRAELRRTVYDTSERTDAAYLFKYVFPFFGAFSDVAEKWGKIVVNDPSVFRQLHMVYNAPDRNNMTEVRDGKTYINIPGEWVKRMSLGVIDRPLTIPKASLDLLFQGNAWWNPGAGWFTQLEASYLIKKVPQLEQTKLIKEILPYGPMGTTPAGTAQDMLIQSPGAKKILALFNENDPTRRNLTVLIAMEENHKFDAGVRDTAPTAQEINDKAKKILALEAASKLVLPFATNTRSPYQFYIDEFHRMRQEDPKNASQNFYDTYGEDYFIFSTSLSKNNTGIAATVEADKRTNQLKDLIAKNPDYGWFIVGDVGQGAFSPAVYERQRNTPVAPGSTTKMRESQDPYTAIKQTETEKGWITYNKGKEILDAQLRARGLTSYNSKNAQDLKDLKDKFTNALIDENPDWAEARGKIDTNKIGNFLKFATNMVNDSRTQGREDMSAMSDYLKGREYVRGLLASRTYKTLNAKDNQDVKDLWDKFTSALVDQYPSFSQIFNRMLENDDLAKGI